MRTRFTCPCLLCQSLRQCSKLIGALGFDDQPDPALCPCPPQASELLTYRSLLVPRLHQAKYSLEITTTPPRATTTTRPCRVRTTSLLTTDRARAPQVRQSSPLLYIEDLYLSQYFPRLAPPPSALSLGRVLSQFDRILTVVQPVGLTVELPSTTHGLAPARTWTGRLPGLPLLDHPGFPETIHGTVFCLIASLEHHLTVGHPRISLP